MTSWLFARRGAALSALCALVLLAMIDLPAARAEEAWAEPREAPTVEELQEAIEALRAEVEALRQGLTTEQRLAEIERRLEIVAAELADLQIGEAAAVADTAEGGLGPAASKVYRSGPGVSIGGYGEAIYQNRDSEREDGSPSGATDSVDFLRGIFYIGYKFNDRFLLNTEIEFEHASTSQGGEVSVEFAYVDYLWKPWMSFRGGLLLVPMGFLNELHEPTVFLGATRTETERRIIPSTWRENGLGLAGERGPWSYRSYLVNGFDASGFSSGGLRGGRQKGSRAKAEDLAWVGRLDYSPTPGLTLGGSLYLGDSGQDLKDLSGRSIGAATSIFEGHAEWRWRGLELRALAARAQVDDAARLNQALGLTGASSIGETLEGGYLQAGYDLLARRGGERSLTPFFRWEELDTQAKVPAGYAADPANDREIFTLGLEYQPIEPLVIKVDYQDVSNAASTGVNLFNVALGYIF